MEPIQSNGEKDTAAHMPHSSLTGLYIHVPFCVSKCPYCDFYSVAFDHSLADRYTDAVCRFFSRMPESPLLEGVKAAEADTVFFGGGTPALLGAKRLERIIRAAASSVLIHPDAEITIEANPSGTDFELLSKLRAIGFNRISLGVQSGNDDELRVLGRKHTAQQALDAAQGAQAAGFSVSLDIIIGIPGQDRNKLRHTIDFCAGAGAGHISAYILTLAHTPRANEANSCNPDTLKFLSRCEKSGLSDDELADLYLFTVEHLTKHNYIQYEISNFAKNGKISRHNTKYWKCASYIGIGPSAHSLTPGGKRFHFPPDITSWASAASTRQPHQSGSCHLNARTNRSMRVQEESPLQLPVFDGIGGDFFEYAMLRLRLSEGLPLDEARRLFHADTGAIEKRAQSLARHGFCAVGADRVSLTPKGFIISNSVITHLLRE